MVDPKSSNNQKLTDGDFDPVDWAIIAVIIGGASLVLSLEHKIETRRLKQKDDAAKKTATGNQIRLKEITNKLESLKSFLKQIAYTAAIKFDEKKSGITKSSIDFKSEKDFQEFNDGFDKCLDDIKYINQLVSEIDLNGITLTKMDIDRYVSGPIKKINEKTQMILSTDEHPYRRLSWSEELLNMYVDFVEYLVNT